MKSLDSKAGHPHWLIAGHGAVAQGWNEALICRGFAALGRGFLLVLETFCFASRSKCDFWELT